MLSVRSLQVLTQKSACVLLQLYYTVKLLQMALDLRLPTHVMVSYSAGCS